VANRDLIVALAFHGAARREISTKRSIVSIRDGIRDALPRVTGKEHWSDKDRALCEMHLRIHCRKQDK
jgi:hypothetical protein